MRQEIFNYCKARIFKTTLLTLTGKNQVAPERSALAKAEKEAKQENEKKRDKKSIMMLTG